MERRCESARPRHLRGESVGGRHIVVSRKRRDGKEQTVDPSDLKTLIDYFHGSLVRALIRLRGRGPGA